VLLKTPEPQLGLGPLPSPTVTTTTATVASTGFHGAVNRFFGSWLLLAELTPAGSGAATFSKSFHFYSSQFSNVAAVERHHLPDNSGFHCKCGCIPGTRTAARLGGKQRVDPLDQ
jgi:hypothetical protein